MRPLSPGGKRLRDDDSAQPPAKKQKTDRDSMAESADDLLEFAAIAGTQSLLECRHAVDVINAALCSNSGSLDLSGFSPATLAAASALIPDAALNKLRHLILPENLSVLPELCNKMQGLQQLELRGFSGRKLDLLKWPQLQQVSGSVATTTDEVHVHSNVDIALTTRRLTKLRCHRVMDNGQVRIHALPGQAYYKTMPGRSQPDFQSLNARTTFPGTPYFILCRHIAEYVHPHLTAKDLPATAENGYLGISTLDDLEQKISPDSDQRFFAELRCSRAYHCVSDTGFGRWVSEQLRELQQAARSEGSRDGQTLSRAFYAISSNHAMVLVLRHKPGSDEQFVEIMMDPNLTLTHMRQADDRLDKIEAAGFSKLLPPQTLDHYFLPNIMPALVFIDPRPRTDGRAPEFNMKHADQGLENLYPVFLGCGIPVGIERFGARLTEIYGKTKQGAASIFNALQANHWQMGSFGLEHAVMSGHAEAVNAHFRLIEDFLTWQQTIDPHDETNQLPEDFCLQLIRPLKNLAQIYALTPAENRAALHAMMEGLNRLYDQKLIPAEACMVLLHERFNDQNLMEAALWIHDEATVRGTGKLLSQLLSQRAIDLSQCGKILDSSCGSPVAAIEPRCRTVLRDCSPSMMDTFAELLTNLRQAAIDNLGNAFDELLGLPHLVRDDFDKQLVMPLLFRGNEASDQIAQLRMQGDERLADRLARLIESASADDPGPFDFRFDAPDE